MLNLIKYEIIGRYKSILSLIIVCILANCALLLRPFGWEDQVLLGFSIFIAVVISAVLFIWCIGIFSQDIYTDKGYLTFTLPKNGYFIIGSKLIVTCIFNIVIGIVSGLSIYYYVTRVVDIGKALDTAGIRINMVSCILTLLLLIIISTASSFIEIYFAITITRLAIFKSKLGKFMAFISYVVLSIVYGVVNWWLIKLFPQQFNINLNLVTSVSGKLSDLQTNGSNIITDGIPMNTATFVFSIVLFVVLFVSTSYLVEKKIDL
jgi:ABC-2 type transport system permease protein